MHSIWDTAVRTSSRKLSDRGRALSYRETFALKWAALLSENFDGPEHIAYHFGVHRSTAEHWLEASHAPSGPAVGWAYLNLPEAAAHHLSVTP